LPAEASVSVWAEELVSASVWAEASEGEAAAGEALAAESAEEVSERCKHDPGLRNRVKRSTA
jgi:hypothetical protein